jgi:hypothetical protein
MNDHRQIDARSLALGRAVAAHLVDEPGLKERARGTLERWLVSCSPQVRPALLEWREVLDGPNDDLMNLLTGKDERAIRLRQSNPFAGVLSPQERNAILKEFEVYEPLSA